MFATAIIGSTVGVKEREPEQAPAGQAIVDPERHEQGQCDRQRDRAIAYQRLFSSACQKIGSSTIVR